MKIKRFRGFEWFLEIRDEFFFIIFEVVLYEFLLRCYVSLVKMCDIFSRERRVVGSRRGVRLFLEGVE